MSDYDEPELSHRALLTEVLSLLRRIDRVMAPHRRRPGAAYRVEPAPPPPLPPTGVQGPETAPRSVPRGIEGWRQSRIDQHERVPRAERPAPAGAVPPTQNRGPAPAEPEPSVAPSDERLRPAPPAAETAAPRPEMARPQPQAPRDEPQPEITAPERPRAVRQAQTVRRVSGQQPTAREALALAARPPRPARPEPPARATSPAATPPPEARPDRAYAALADPTPAPLPWSEIRPEAPPRPPRAVPPAAPGTPRRTFGTPPPHWHADAGSPAADELPAPQPVLFYVPHLRRSASRLVQSGRRSVALSAEDAERIRRRLSQSLLDRALRRLT